MKQSQTSKIMVKAHHKGLRYPKFSIVYMQIFGMSKLDSTLFDGDIIKLEDDLTGFNNNGQRKNKQDIDKQIFDIGDGEESPVERYNLRGFNIEINLADEDYHADIIIKGRVNVDMALFFNKTIVLTFSIMVDNDINNPISCSAIGGDVSTDQLISLLSMTLSGEHWSSEESEDDQGVVKTASTINLKSSNIKISDLYVNSDGDFTSCPIELEGGKTNIFELITANYRKAISKNQMQYNYKHLDFVYVDIWEDVDNYDSSLQAMEKEEDMIRYINQHRKKEMIGLMSLYPNEWPYRDEESFDQVCGSNIAIDTDDLILLNSSVCVVFGTYGRRSKSAATDWADHLQIRNSYYVSWPEYMLILEMVLAKKYTISAAKDFLLKTTSFSQDSYSIRQSIERNAAIELVITQLLLKLDAVNYSKFISHKIMFDRTLKRLDIETDENKLKEIMAKVENSLSTLSNMRSIKQAERFNIILGGITVASLFQVIMAEVEMPFFSKLGYHWADTVGMFIVGVCMVLVFIGMISLTIVAIQNRGINFTDAIVKAWKKMINRETKRIEF